MPSSNGKYKSIHLNTLRPSNKGVVGLGEAVHVRFIELCELYFRVKGIQLIPPKYLDKDMVLWRTMMVRYKKRDFRHTEDEKESVKRIAEWTLREKCLLANKEYIPLEWGEF